MSSLFVRLCGLFGIQDGTPVIEAHLAHVNDLQAKYDRAVGTLKAINKTLESENSNWTGWAKAATHATLYDLGEL